MHPTHVQDVMTAIGWLQRTYGFGERYVLVGHSCGATIAFQTVMGIWSIPTEHGGDVAISKPVAIVGVAGIYNLGLLASTYETVPIYREFLEGAFGPDRIEWLKANPTSGEYEKTWPNAKVVVLGWSKDDSLVDATQVQCMSRTLFDNQQVGRSERVLQFTGEHDEIWRNGQCLAAAITTALTILTADTA
jgi:acetyl esterase/lipase